MVDDKIGNELSFRVVKSCNTMAKAMTAVQFFSYALAARNPELAQNMVECLEKSFKEYDAEE